MHVAFFSEFCSVDSDEYRLRHRPFGKRSEPSVGTWGEPSQLNSTTND